ncbi:IFNW1 [Cervus elaphus hippelaphus]|uniref:IFNW1 n=1 Tax=Cervus elaphus hippelaphus TaxID=46360 RepID=A0A212C5B1_CEREH|nr:IFNW1 [Cervus elaphus hippelaphus]
MPCFQCLLPGPAAAANSDWPFQNMPVCIKPAFTSDPRLFSELDINSQNHYLGCSEPGQPKFEKTVKRTTHWLQLLNKPQRPPSAGMEVFRFPQEQVSGGQLQEAQVTCPPQRSSAAWDMTFLEQLCTGLLQQLADLDACLGQVMGEEDSALGRTGPTQAVKRYFQGIHVYLQEKEYSTAVVLHGLQVLPKVEVIVLQVKNCRVSYSEVFLLHDFLLDWLQMIHLPLELHKEVLNDGLRPASAGEVSAETDSRSRALNLSAGSTKDNWITGRQEPQAGARRRWGPGSLWGPRNNYAIQLSDSADHAEWQALLRFKCAQSAFGGAPAAGRGHPNSP